MRREPRVLIDATALPAARGGVGRYVDELVGALGRAGADLIVACPPGDAEVLAAKAPSARIETFPSAAAGVGRRLAWEQTGLPLLARRSGAAVIHCPHYTMPLIPTRPTVVTLHDGTFFTHPDLHTPLKRRVFRAATRHAAWRAAACIVVSATTRDELSRLLGPTPIRFRVIHHGVDPDVFRPPTDEESSSAAALIGPSAANGWISFVGTIEPRKNVPNLVKAWAAAIDGRATPPALVLAGAPGWEVGLDRAINALPDRLRPLVCRLGYVPLAELRGIIGGSTVFAYPSLGEGFGLPVLEAMACGAPVLTTKRLALGEVAGHAAAYCEPTVASIADGLRAILDDPERRRQLIDDGAKRAGAFTWDHSAAAHLAVYRDAAAGRDATRPEAAMPDDPSADHMYA